MKYLVSLFLTVVSLSLFAQTGRDGYTSIHIDKVPQHVQPMTGIVFWDGQYETVGKEAISMEFSYMLFNDIVKEKGVYDWTKVEKKLDDIASRNHQAIFRFRYVYVGRLTSVPDYIKDLPDYHETEGISEGQTTWFPDWTNQELKDFTLEFYTKFAEKYDNDPRIAFIEVGFGLWAEYHIYDGPFELGVTFPSKEFQEDFFYHMDTTFVVTPFMISIDAASDKYSPFEEKPELKELHFGLFDDSFMHEEFGKPGEYNTESWNFFDRNRYKVSPAGGEFSYYTDYDQEHVLDLPDGSHGKPFEYFAKEFHITFIIGNDQPNYQPASRIKQASMASGYMFKVSSFLSKQDSSLVTVKNVGIAPIYYDAFITVDGIRSTVSLKYLLPGDSIICPVSAGGVQPELTITSDRLVEGQEIEFYGTENYLGLSESDKKSNLFIFPNPVKQNSLFYLQAENRQEKSVKIYGVTGQLVYSGAFQEILSVSANGFEKGLYIVTVDDGQSILSQKIVVE
jgi:hypothetical protein